MTKRRWFLAVLLLGVSLLVADAAFSRALSTSAARRYLIAHLTASFGRPVEVSWFDFSLLDGARIRAHFVSVSDDPEFGNEYFLRADALAAGLRWMSLFAGRFEFGSVSMSRPSLNLARDAEGRWNIERWLPPVPEPGTRPGFVGPLAPLREVQPERPYRIDVDGGRINFKQGDNKGAFALVDVSGSVGQNGAGRWQLDVEARPMRAGVELQDIGLLRLRGSIAGTTARLQPAQLNLTWRAASLADTLRLVQQNDYGMRGQLAVDLSAKIAPPETSSNLDSGSRAAQWSVSAVARLTGLHGWRLPQHDTDPAVNVSVQVNWRPGDGHAEIENVLVELPESHLQGAGALDWAHGFQPQLTLESSKLGFGDVLSWYRAIRPDVAEDLRASGMFGVDLKIGGWPVQFQQGEVSSAGGSLTGKPLSEPLQIGAFKATVAHGGFDFVPVAVSFASSAPPGKTVIAAKSDAAPGGRALRNFFEMRGSLYPRANGVFRWPPDWNFSIEGETPRVEDWLALSTVLAYPMSSEWNAQGGLALKMRRLHLAVSPEAPWLGSADFLGLTFSPSFVNQPVHLPKTHVEFAPLQRTITLSAAEAFGAVWRGSIARKYLDKAWTFDLSADHLDVVELDRWLGPRARPGFLARFAGLNSAAAPILADDAVVTRLAARGHLRVAALDLSPMHLDHLDADAELSGRTVRIRKAQADFFSGKIFGSLDAELVADPSYQFQGRFERVDLARLGHAVPFLDTRIGGTAFATLALSAHGIGRQNLVRSTQGQGTLNGKNIELRGFHLSGALSGGRSDNDSDTFASVQGTYRIQTAGIDLASLVMDNSRGRLQAEGRIDFSHSLNIRVHPSIFQAAAAPVSVLSPSILLGGTIEIPKLVVPAGGSKPPARSGGR